MRDDIEQVDAVILMNTNKISVRVGDTCSCLECVGVGAKQEKRESELSSTLGDYYFCLTPA